MNELTTWQCPPDSCSLGLVSHQPRPGQKYRSGVGSTEAAGWLYLTKEVTEGEKGRGMLSSSVWLFWIFPVLKLGLYWTIPTLLSLPCGQQTHLWQDDRLACALCSEVILGHVYTRSTWAAWNTKQRHECCNSSLRISAVQQRYNASQVSNFKFSISHNLKSKEKQIKFILTYSLISRISSF